MALHRLLGIEIGVPKPDILDGFYQEIGFTGGDHRWGPDGGPTQIGVTEAPYRQLVEMRVACESEADIAEIEKNLSGLGIDSKHNDGKLRLTDPVNKWTIVVEPQAVDDIPQRPKRLVNRPGERPRIDQRHELIQEDRPRTPRRLGHVVTGTTDVASSVKLYAEGLGFRISDTIAGMAFFLRCSPDHHNFLITPGEIPYLNHYAMEHDDIDAVCRAATVYERAHQDVHLSGPGRHPIGGNMFWYMKDPSGNFFEFFADMDRIIDDKGWQVRDDWPLDDSWSLWGDKNQPEVFFRPDDMDDIIAGWNKMHG